MPAEWEQKKLVDSTLMDYVHAQMHTQGWGRERAFISDYFNGQSYITVDQALSPYQHNLAQYVLKKFFEEVNGFTKILETNTDNQAPTFEEIQTDLNQTFRGYSEAAIGYKTPDGDKVLVIIERQDERQVDYRVYSTENRGDLLKQWLALSLKDNYYRGKKINAAACFLDLSALTWDDVILPKKIVHLLKGIVTKAISKQHLFIKNKIDLKQGVMLSGGPGNGKTTAIKVVAKEVPPSVTVIYAQPSHLMMAKDVRSVCSMARDLSPAVLIIEDIDWIAEDRNTGDAGRVIELMNQLDGLEEFNNVITIATTNDVDKIEKAVKNRPGRFDRVITIDNPDEDCRRRMLKLFTQHWVIDPDVDIEKVIKFTNELSGAHMRDLCKTAATKAIYDDSLTPEEIVIVKACHFEEAVAEVKNKDFATHMKQKGTDRKMGFNNYDPDDDDY